MLDFIRTEVMGTASRVFHFIAFPGIVVHEISHRFFCDLFGVPVYKIQYITFSDKVYGYVIHGKIENIMHRFLISMSPLLINTLLCGLLTFPLRVILPYPQCNTLECCIINIMLLILFWIGISCGVHAFPSNHDVECMVKYKTTDHFTLYKFVINFFYYFVKICNYFMIPILEWAYACFVSTAFYHYLF